MSKADYSPLYEPSMVDPKDKESRTVWIYDQGTELKVFATRDAAEKWIAENDTEGVAFEWPVDS